MVGWMLIAAGAGLWFLPWLKGTLGLAMAMAGLLVMGAGWSVLQWPDVSPDRPLYRLTVTQEGEGAWRIELRDGETLRREQRVQGDVLEITGRLLVLEGPGVGALQLYRTDSIRGFDSGMQSPLRFRAGQAARIAHWIDIWHWDRMLALPMVRAEALYPLWVPMVAGAVFEVILQGNQIVPVPVNEAADQALQERE